MFSSPPTAAAQAETATLQEWDAQAQMIRANAIAAQNAALVAAQAEADEAARHARVQSLPRPVQKLVQWVNKPTEQELAFEKAQEEARRQHPNARSTRSSSK
jgi:cell division protein FtsB